MTSTRPFFRGNVGAGLAACTAAALAVSGLALGAAPAARADNPVIAVTTWEDSGPGSLREAIAEANTRPGPDIIEIDSGLIVAVESPLETDGDVTIRATVGGRATIAADGPDWGTDPAHSTMLVVSGNFTSESIEFQGNRADVSGMFVSSWETRFRLVDTTFDNFMRTALSSSKPAFSQDTEPFTLERVTVKRSGKADEFRGGAIDLYLDAPVLVRDSTFSDNRGYPVSFDAENLQPGQQAIIENSAFIGGSAMSEGCVILDVDVSAWNGGEFTEPAGIFRNNTVDGCVSPGEPYYNIAPVNLLFGAEGAPETVGDVGILVEGNTVRNSSGWKSTGFSYRTFTSEPDFTASARFVNNTVIADPASELPAVALTPRRSANLEITNNTLLGGGVTTQTVWIGDPPSEPEAPVVTLSNNAIDSGGLPAVTILDAPDETPARVEGTHNAVTELGTDLPADAATVLTRAEMLLGDPAANGNPHAPLSLLPGPGSPLIDAASELPTLPGTDQRGAARVAGPAPDIGSVEAPYTPPVEVSISADLSVAEGSEAVFTVTRTGSPSEPASVTVSTADDTALAGTDYTAHRAELTWAAGETAPIQVTIPTRARAGVQAERAFTVNLTEHGEGTVAGERSSARATITEVSDPGPTPSPSPSVPQNPGQSPGPGGHGPGGGLPNTGAPAWGLSAGLGALFLAAGGVLLARRSWRANRDQLRG